jgi:inositol oxygenase
MMDHQPLPRLDDWDDFIGEVYSNPQKRKDEFRNYDEPGRASVREFYRLNHRFQTYDFVLRKREEFCSLSRMELPVWEALEYLNTLVDDSDPDIELSQLQHLLQTAEAIRADGHPEWFVLTGLLHDLGKVLCIFGEPQWAVVGDTFPVGCAFSEKIVYSEYFADNPDIREPRFQSRLGIYQPNCGLNQVTMSWGHDEYLYHAVREYMPEPALYMIRYHSFYAQHREEAYGHLMNEHDRAMFVWVRRFNPYDLYSKAPVPPDVDELMPYYQRLVQQYLPKTLRL